MSISVEVQLQEVKVQLEKIMGRLDDLVMLEARHDNTVESVQRCHSRVDKLEHKIETLQKEVGNNSFVTGVGERLVWLVISAGIGIAAYFLKV